MAKSNSLWTLKKALAHSKIRIALWAARRGPQLICRSLESDSEVAVDGLIQVLGSRPMMTITTLLHISSESFSLHPSLLQKNLSIES
jgi:hypothetical protein